MFVMISVLGLSFGTIPDFQVLASTNWIFCLYFFSSHPMQVTEYVSSNRTVEYENGTSEVVEEIELLRIEHPAFVFTERICIAFFTIEYALRLFAAPRKLRFALKPLNLV
jgi:hypothetical protein